MLFRSLHRWSRRLRYGYFRLRRHPPYLCKRHLSPWHNLDNFFASAEQFLFRCQPSVEFSEHFPSMWFSEPFNMDRGVLRPAFQMAVDDDILVKNPFGFQLAGVLVNDAVTRKAITKDQMRKFLKFVHDDVVYCKYYEVVYILFHTGMRISEFCGLTLKDIDLENRTVNIEIGRAHV